MEELEQHIAAALRLQDPSFHSEIQTDAGRVDLVIVSGDDAYVVEIKNATADVNSLGRVYLLMQNPQLLGAFQPVGSVKGVLAAPSFARNVEALAERIGLTTVTLPMPLLRDRVTDVAPLTDPKAWNVVIEVLRRDHNPGVRRLADASGTSLGWTSAIVRSLEGRGIIAEGGEVGRRGVLRLLDQVATERPLEKHRIAAVDTGIHDWDDAIGHLESQWPDIISNLDPPGFFLCGKTAALSYVDHILHHGTIQVYANDPDTLTAAMEGVHQGGGVVFNVYMPDRPMSPGARGEGPRRCCSLSQTILDLAGMGYAARDTALKLVEALQREH